MPKYKYARRLKPELAREIILDLGGFKAVGEKFGLTTPAVRLWAQDGMPDYRFKIIQLEHPTMPSVMRAQAWYQAIEARSAEA